MTSGLYTNSGATSTTAGTPSFASVPFGAEPGVGETRHIIVSISVLYTANVSRQITAVTIGGVAATRLLRAVNSTAPRNSEVWIAEVPTGTSGTVSITSTDYDRWSIAAYRVINLGSTTPTDTLATSLESGGTLDVSAGGFVIAVSSRNRVDDDTLSGVVEDYNASAGTLHRGIHGSLLSASATTITINVTDIVGNVTIAAVAML